MAAKARKSGRKKNGTRTATPGKGETCFVIMPFGGWLDDYYESIYKPAIVAVGLEPRRADDLFRPSTIVNDIWAYTKSSKLLIADLTQRNPNVFYELGLAHALAKPVIMIAESMDDIPFDLRALRIIVYDKNAPDWGAILSAKIESAMREVLAAPVAAVLPAFLNAPDAEAKPALSAHDRELIQIRQELDAMRRELRSGDRGHRGIDIGPAEATRRIERYLRDGLPEEMIVRRLERLGPPADWIRVRIRELRSGQDSPQLGIGDPVVG